MIDSVIFQGIVETCYPRLEQKHVKMTPPYTLYLVSFKVTPQVALFEEVPPAEGTCEWCLSCVSSLMYP